MSNRPVIRFVHEGKAAYPDVAAFKAHFDGPYETIECSPEEAARADRLGRTACWYMMGFYPTKLGCALTIHDYRSLSVGNFRRAKDKLKRLFNANPDLRLFQNDAIRRALGFREDARTYYLQMGVPQLFIDSRHIVAEPAVDFIYIGSMLAERRCELMLDSFVKRFGSQLTFDLWGQPNPELETRYSAHSNIRFRGFAAQERLPAILKSARVGVCYFPLHYPHVLQTPTKLLEYGALGMRILANEHPQSRATQQQYGLNCYWGLSEDLFATIPDNLAIEDNMRVDAQAMAWASVIEASGVRQALNRLLPPCQAYHGQT